MYCVMRIEKRKASDMAGLQREARREMPEGKYNNQVKLKDSKNNIFLQDSNNWLQDIRRVIQAAGARERSNSVVGIDAIYTASPNWFKEKSQEEIERYFQGCLAFHKVHYGVVVSAVIHMDETTPHMHVMSVPLTQDNRLSAREIVGNKGKMSSMQTRFFEDVGRPFGLQRGEVTSTQERREHISAQEHRIEQNKQTIQQQRETIQQIAEQQLETCKQAVQTMEQRQRETDRLRGLRQHNQQLRADNKRLQRSNDNLQQQIDRASDRLDSIQAQTARALQAKRQARAEERAAAQVSKAVEENQLLRQQVTDLQLELDRLQPQQHTYIQEYER